MKHETYRCREQETAMAALVFVGMYHRSPKIVKHGSHWQPTQAWLCSWFKPKLREGRKEGRSLPEKMGIRRTSENREENCWRPTAAAVAVRNCHRKERCREGSPEVWPASRIAGKTEEGASKIAGVKRNPETEAVGGCSPLDGRAASRREVPSPEVIQTPERWAPVRGSSGA